MKKSAPALLATALAIAGVFAMAAPVYAAPTHTALVNSATSSTSTQQAPGCVAAVKAALSKGLNVTGVDCTITTTATTSAAIPATVAAIKSDSSLTSAQESQLVQLAAAGAVQSKHYSWFTTGAAYTVTQNGTFYYDGSHAWVGTTYRGYKGSHACFTNYAVGLNITNEACSESGGTSSRTMYFQWRVTWFPGPPYWGLNYSVSNTGIVYSNGTTS